MQNSKDLTNNNTCESKAITMNLKRRLSNGDKNQLNISNTSMTNNKVAKEINNFKINNYRKVLSLSNISKAHPPTRKLRIMQFEMKQSFSKFDALQKKNLKNDAVDPTVEKKCSICDKVVFQMEQIKAEKKFFHKNCFKCSECSKQLSVDTYESNEGVLYCKAHFKSLFTPKVVEETEKVVKPRKAELIILENQPAELPPDVVRSSDKSDFLEELQSLNLRQKFEMFEKGVQEETKEIEKPSGNVKRSASILSKLARFKSKGMDVGIDEENLVLNSSEENSEVESSEEEYDDENDEDIELIRARRAARKEKPIAFKEMNDIKSKFESGQIEKKEVRREERKQELQNIRSRLFMGKNAKIKEMYQQAVADSEQTITASGKTCDIDISDKTKSIKSMFEKGEFFDEEERSNKLNEDEMDVFEKGIAKKSRSLFLELDASQQEEKSTKIQRQTSSASKHQSNSRSTQIQRTPSEIVKCDTKVDDVEIEVADVASKFAFFEQYKAPSKERKTFRITPPRDGVVRTGDEVDSEVYKDPNMARNDVNAQEDFLDVVKSHTTSKMLSHFKQLEEKKRDVQVGPKPLKRFTPPPEGEKRLLNNDDSEPDYTDSEEEYDEEEEEEEEEECEEEEEIYKSKKDVDEFLAVAQSAERAKKLREKFEKWEQNEIKKEMNGKSIVMNTDADNDDGQWETAKSLRSRFEQMQKNEEPKLASAPRMKVNRFV